MTENTPPKRRHILSSINPDMPPRDGEAAAASDGNDDPDTTRPRRTRLKLKEHKLRRRRSRSPHNSHESSRHRRRHRRRSPTPPNPFDPPPLDPDVAFRESLFDAMADDEGASYWESVYGQPIHVYSDEKVGPQGELERMTEEEYAAHVRQKMWEKTNAGLLEERERREQRRKQQKEEQRQARKVQEEMDRSLRRGEERRQQKRWAAKWDEYTAAWASWDGTPEALAWPVESGLRKDVTEEHVREFFMCGLELKQGDKAAALKEERVRWHPDKVQQRVGGKLDEDVTRAVTAVFQTIDRLWGDMKR